MTNPAISIIIPVYNASATIRKCLDSILDQTFKDYELLLINDGSKDDSLTILREYEGQHSQIKVIDKENQGASLTRNLGLSLAQGEHIVFIDSDDFIDKNYLEAYYQVMTEQGCDIVIGGYKQVRSDGQVSTFSLNYPQDSWTKYLIMAPWAKMYRKSFLFEHGLTFMDYTMEDLHFNAWAYSKTDKIALVDNLGYNNFVNMESTTHTLHKGIRPDVDFLVVFDRIAQDVAPTDEVTFFYKKSYIYYLLFSGRHSDSQTFLKEHDRITTWLKEKKLDSKVSPFDSAFRSEPFKTKFAIFVFDWLDKLSLLPLFAKLYCRKSD